MPVTIEDISRQLGLSVSTVSKALNDYNDVSDATKQRVRMTAESLGYTPSAAARNLRRKRTEKIGFSYGFPTTYIGEFASRLINGAVAAAEMEGYNITLYPLTQNRLEQLVRITRAREVDGWLLMGGEYWEQTVALLKQEGTPFIVLNRTVKDTDVSFVTSDDRQAGQLITEHLLALGHRRIAYVIRSNHEMNWARIEGYKNALAQATIEFDPELIVPTELAQGTAYQAMNNLLDLAEPPSAVIGIYDAVAAECLRAAVDRGLRVPEDVAIAGSDNMRESLATNPPLTTLHPNLSEIGRYATEALLAQVADQTTEHVRQTFPVRLVVRESTAARQ